MPVLNPARSSNAVPHFMRAPDRRFWTQRARVARRVSPPALSVRLLRAYSCTLPARSFPIRGLTPPSRWPLRQLSQPFVATRIGDPKSGYATSPDTVSAARAEYDAVIVGAGPAGITVLGNLLERNVGNVLWVDDRFAAGRVNRAYREVPSNTKTKLFIDFAEAVAPFREIIQNSPSPNPVDALRKLEQGKGCDLGKAADMLLMLTDGLIKHPRVKTVTGRVNAAGLTDSNTWSVSFDCSDRVARSPRLVLCTGSSPTESELPVQIDNISPLVLDTALSPSALAEKLPRDKATTVAVIGASHSAILVLRNLSVLALGSHPELRIKWFTRHALRYAEFMDGWILRDNTGLKGEAADWARENLEGAAFDSSPVRRVIRKVAYRKGDERIVLERQLPGCQHYIQAIGFTRDPLPELERDGKALTPAYNHADGSFSVGSGGGEKVPGLYGAGIAWPERVTDPRGNVEYAVGFWKFMKFVKRVSPDWN